MLGYESISYSLQPKRPKNEPFKYARDPDTGLVRAVLHRFDFEAGEVLEGHLHDVDHGTVLNDGKVMIKWRRADGSAKGSKIFEGYSIWTTRKDTFHTTIALTKATMYCLFTPHEGYEEDLRDFWYERVDG